LLPLLTRFGITSDNLGYFVLDNAPNNDTTLVELAKILKFDPKHKRLRCMGHILNLVAESYLFGQDAASFEEDYKKAGAPARRQLWRQRRELGKLHNLVAHVMASGKRDKLFLDLQTNYNEGKAAGRSLKLILDGGIRWNASYMMIKRALLLRESLDVYAAKLRLSEHAIDVETYDEDYLSDTEWKALELIANQLEPLFRATKSLEGNTKLNEGAGKPSHGALWELLPVFEYLLANFEKLERQAKEGQFNDHPGIQQSITLAWNKTQEYYKKTDASIAWMAALVLHPRWKWSFFEEHWTGGEARFVTAGRTKLKKLWEDQYKKQVVIRVEEHTPEPTSEERDWMADILDEMAPTLTRAQQRSSRRDHFQQYLDEPVTMKAPLAYWRDKEEEWPQLAAMAFDFLAIPAMSSECERVFSSCAKLTTPESSKLSGEILWHQCCLSNWQRRGAIEIMRWKNAVLLDI
jgi:hypothetical protein